MNFQTLIQRFLVPRILVTIYYLLRYRCFVSPRAEVEISSCLRIGRGSEIGSFCKLKATIGPLSIGQHVTIGSNSFVAAGTGGIEIGDYTMLGPGVTIVANSYRFDRLDIPMCRQQKTSLGIRIGSDVWIGAGAVLVDGVTVGKGAIIGAGSVVNRPVEEFTIVAGVPARVIGDRRERPAEGN